MAQKYYNSEETAKILGISVDEVKKMVDRRELHGYRDGADWKFKVEDIDRLAKQRPAETAVGAAPEEEGGDVLLSEVALGQSDMGTSGTVIAMDGIGPRPGRERHPAGRQRHQDSPDMPTTAQPSERSDESSSEGRQVRGVEPDLGRGPHAGRQRAPRCGHAGPGQPGRRRIGHRPQRQGPGRRRPGARRQRQRQRHHHRRRQRHLAGRSGRQRPVAEAAAGSRPARATNRWNSARTTCSPSATAAAVARRN